MVELSFRSQTFVIGLSDTLGEGEAQAIALALEKKDRLFIGDLKGRRVAENFGIESTTTLGVVFELFVRGALTKTDYLRNVKNYARLFLTKDSDLPWSV
jgi:predicted nucleic acid-binding protein